MNEVSWTVLLRVVDGQFDAFMDLTREMVTAARKEPGCIIFERYICDDQRGFVRIVERYQDSDAAIDHLTTFFDSYSARFSQFVERREFQVFGPVNPELRSILQQFQPAYHRLADGFSRFDDRAH